MNRATRRQLIKAATCIDRTSKIPGRILTSLARLNPDLLSGLAAKHGKRIMGDGSVKPSASSTALETGAADAVGA